MLMLHIGCGDIYFDNWVNIDINTDKADLNHDLRQPLPYEDNSVDYIYHEHFIEHLTTDECEIFLKEMRRLLKRNGVMRIATPDLDYIVFRYIYRWRKQVWIKKYSCTFIQTKAEMMNVLFHRWGHKWLYNYEELKRRLNLAGFDKVHRVKFRKSTFTQLQGLESREDSKLIVETVK